MTSPLPIRYLTIAQYCAAYPWPGVRTLRHWIFQAQDNGADAWIRRIGRTIVIDVPALHAWIDEAGRAPAPPARKVGKGGAGGKGGKGKARR